VHIGVTFALNRDAARDFQKFTGEHVGTYLAIVLDGEMIACPLIMSAVPGKGVILGGGEEPDRLERARRLAAVLNAKPLPFSVKSTEARVRPLPSR
jgi:preprotein translocase subunit SecD